MNRGFTLLAALLVTTILISVGTAVSTIALRRVKLSISARESTKAFFAADSGLECMEYWDLNRNQFASDPEQSIQCLGETWTTESVGGSIVLEINEHENGLCSYVTLTKNPNGTNANESRIESRGYNTCNESDPRRVERALRITYK